ncbi:MAG TPA: efflux RND transporter permease subunit [Thermoanaerobaculia bacterium]|jgi:multidrug efflux pump subunit AcrB
MTQGLGPAGKIGRFFIDSKLTPLLVAAALGLGAFAVALTPREEEPQIVVPIVDLFVGLPGASPTEVENRVTVPLEKRLWEVPGVEYVYASSMPGLAMVTVRFYVGEDQQRSLVKVYDKLASGLDRMPAGATPPLVKVRSIDDVPVLALTLHSPSPSYGSFELRRMAAELRRELASLDDVSEVRLTGGERRQVRVFLDAERLAGSGLDPASVAAALEVQNAAVPAGSYQDANREVLVETGAFLRDAGEVAELVVGVHGARPVYLRDVAAVVDGAEEPTTHVFFKDAGAGGLSPAVTLSLAKRQGADAHHVVQEALAKVEDLRGRLLPPEVEVTVTRDYGYTAKEKADELLLHLILAIVSVSVVIGLFLGWRGALVVFISVPVSFALTLFVYYVFGYTLNRVTLFALIFVTGIVVDDSIIVVENIVRHFAMKKLPPLQASIAAVNEVGNPTILATLTVIAAVLPMAFVRGLMGPYMEPMPVGASLAMAFSLFVALIAAPWLAYRLLKGGAGHEGHEDEGHGIEESRVYRVYRRILLPLLASPRRSWTFLGVIFALLLGAMLLVPAKLVSVKMLPFDNKSELQVVIDMPEGTTLEATTAAAREIADALAEEPEVTNVQLYAGTAAPINFNGLVRHYDLRTGPHVADLQVNLVHKGERDDQSHPIAKRLRPRVQEIAERHGAAAKVVEVPPGPPVLSTLVAEVYGPDEEARVDLAGRIRDVFLESDGVVDVDWFVEAPQERRVFRVDRERAALHGVPAAQVARTLRLVLDGEDAGLLHADEEAEPVAIRLELPRAARSSVADLGDVKLASTTGSLVSLSELVRVEETTLDASRHRKNLKPVVYVTGDVAGDAESPVYAILAMAEKIDAFELPEGGKVEQFYRDEPWSEERPAMKWDGEWHITYEVFRDLGAAFGVVLILIYLLIIGWFGSFKVPLVMMIAIPLGLIGVLPGHWLFGAFFTATSMIGFIALAGIMVRNSVLLIDFVNLALERGRTLGEAVIEAGAVRFRPILLTAGTVVVGAVVILFDPIFQGLAIALMTGAIASTALTLVVVPLVYFMTEKRRHERPLPEAWLPAPPADEEDEPAPARPAEVKA